MGELRRTHGQSVEAEVSVASCDALVLLARESVQVGTPARLAPNPSCEGGGAAKRPMGYGSAALYGVLAERVLSKTALVAVRRTACVVKRH